MNSDFDFKSPNTALKRSKSKNSSCNGSDPLMIGSKTKRKGKSKGHNKSESLNDLGSRNKLNNLNNLNIVIDDINLHCSTPKSSRIMEKEEEEELERLRIERMKSGVRRGAFYAANTTPIFKEFNINDKVDEAPSSNSGLVTLHTTKIRGNKERKNNIVSRSKRLHCGYAETIGRRSRMEDDFIFHGSIEGNELLDFFGVFDGHNGVEASSFVAKTMSKILIKNLEKMTDMRKILNKTFMMTNKLMMKQNVAGGTTALVGLFKDNICYIVNAGDSRAVFSTNGKIKKITRDHRPDRIDEIKRITDLGGEITSMVSKDGMFYLLLIIISLYLHQMQEKLLIEYKVF